MVPAAITGGVVEEVAALLKTGDIVIDAGNRCYRDDVDRAAELARRGIHYVDVGTSRRGWRYRDHLPLARRPACNSHA
jgi:6-phosphogluconate dehydrogenase